MAHQFLLVDVFTDRPFGGNQLAVFCDAEGVDPALMQPFARELNFSETVFVLPPSDAANTARLRIFTPEAEIPFAGHPVIGTTFALDKHCPHLDISEEIRLELESGVVPVRVHRSDDGVLLHATMKQHDPVFLAETAEYELLSRALGIDPRDILVTGLPCEIVSTGLPFHVVPVGSLEAVQNLEPHMGKLAEVGRRVGVSDVYVFSFDTVASDATLHTRMFAPSYGIPEDPATGSAAGCLGAYLVKNRAVPPSKFTRLVVEQGLEMGRPSRLHVEIESDGKPVSAVWVGGSAVVVGQGSLEV